MKQGIGVLFNVLWLVGLYFAATSIPQLTGVVVAVYLVLTLLYITAGPLMFLSINSDDEKAAEKALAGIFTICRGSVVGKISTYLFYPAALFMTSYYEWWFTFGVVVVNLIAMGLIKLGCKAATEEFIKDSEFGQQFVDDIIKQSKEK